MQLVIAKKTINMLHALDKTSSYDEQLIDEQLEIYIIALVEKLALNIL